MPSQRGNLKPAHSGYRYQDIATAYLLVRALVERQVHIIVDRKHVDDDRFDDLEVATAKGRIRRQIKSSENANRLLSINDFTGASSSLRIDRLISTFLQAGADAADEYRLCATWLPPSVEDDLTRYLVAAQGEATFEGSTPQFFRLVADAIWPLGELPAWHILSPAAGAPAEFDRQQLVAFCDRFLIELDLPLASQSLIAAGPFEKHLLDLLAGSVGIGRYPNDDREVVDVAALAIELATRARTKEALLTPDDVAHELGIRTDYGRVAQAFPLDLLLYHDRPVFRQLLADQAMLGGKHLVIAGPGAGKSWELTQLAYDLRARGAIVARHYCFLEPGDELVERRITTNIFFANLLGELTDACADQVHLPHIGFAAGMDELEQSLQRIQDSDACRVVLIVDGLDHIARVRAASNALNDNETDIVERLATLDLPPCVSIIIGSQPGVHLAPLREHWHDLTEHAVPPWAIEDLVEIARRHGVDDALKSAGFGDDDARGACLTHLGERADGNPLYARYLARAMIDGLGSGEIDAPDAWLASNPAIEGDIAKYYAHLYANASAQAQSIADLFGSIDFSVSEGELLEILPSILRGRLTPALKVLAPVLTATTGQGGLRIFHESFRRFMLDELARKGIPLQDVLEPVIAWLEQHTFLADVKSFRFLLPLLHRAGRSVEVLTHIAPSFVADSIAHAHPAPAIHKNLALAANIAADTKNWPILVRCVELRRALATCDFDRPDAWPQYWETYIHLFGTQAAAERLVFEGKPTQSRSEGLLACQLVDNQGGTAPWSDYLSLQDDAGESSHYEPCDCAGTLSSDERVTLAVIQGRLRLGGHRRMCMRVYRHFLGMQDDLNPLLVRHVGLLLAEMVGPDIVENMAQRGAPDCRGGPTIPLQTMVALHLALAQFYARQDDQQQSLANATIAAQFTNLPSEGIACLKYGVPPDSITHLAIPLAAIAIGVASGEFMHESANVRQWFDGARIWAGIAHRQETLDAERSRMQGEGWYRCWLRFVLALAGAEASKLAGRPYAIKAAFDELAGDIAPFRGSPRACDLYVIEPIIRESLAIGMSLLGTADDWEHALGILSAVQKGTASHMDREDGGPIRKGDLIELVMPYVTCPTASPIVSKFVEQAVEDVHASGTYYATHAEYTLWLAQMQNGNGESAAAHASWQQAGVYLSAYGHHKDVTLFDLIKSAPALSASSPVDALVALAKLQPLLSAALLHTDGRETKRAPNAWFRSLLSVAPVPAIELLARTLLDDECIESWPTVEGIEQVLIYTSEQGHPLVVDALWETILFDIKYENQGASMADDRLQVFRRLHTGFPAMAAQRIRRLLAEAADDAGRYSADAVQRLHTAAIELGFHPTLTETSAGADARRTQDPPQTRRGVDPLQFPERPAFPADPTLVQLLAGLRKAGHRVSRHTAHALDDVVLPLSYRLGELVDNGQADDARRLLVFLAHDVDIRSYEAPHPLNDVALALDNAGYAVLAATAYTLAYTAASGGGGWLSFGDSKQSPALNRAIALDRAVAEQTIADEVAYRFKNLEYGAGLSRHLVERIAEWGDPAKAVAAWGEAYGVIAARLPLPGHADWFASLDPHALPAWSLDDALCALLLVRVSDPQLSRKLAALAGVGRLIRTAPYLMLTALRWWLGRDTPTSSLLLVLKTLLDAEAEPYTLTIGLQDILAAYACSDCWGGRVLGGELLRRAGLAVPALSRATSLDTAVGPLSPGEQKTLVALDTEGMLANLMPLWPELPQRVARRFLALKNNDKTFEERNRSSFKLSFGRQGKAIPATPVLHWPRELFVVALNDALLGLDEYLWRTGTWHQDIARQVLLHTMPDTVLHLALAASRVARPAWALPRDLTSECGDLVQVADSDADYPGWTRLGMWERQYFNAEGKDYLEPTAAAIAFAGVCVSRPDGTVPTGLFPFEPGEPGAWWWAPVGEAVDDAPQPRMVRLQPVTDWLGEAGVLIPPSILCHDFNMQAPDYGEPLMWRGEDGQPVVVLRMWRVRNFHAHEAEPVSLIGSDLIVHPRILAQLMLRSAGLMRQVQLVHRADVGD
jgi:hypothetical protein